VGISDFEDGFEKPFMSEDYVNQTITNIVADLTQEEKNCEMHVESIKQYKRVPRKGKVLTPSSLAKRVKQKEDRVGNKDPDFHYPDLKPAKKKPKKNEKNGCGNNIGNELVLEDYVLSSLIREEEKHFLKKIYAYEKGDVK
jgi:hypothetical protein